MAEVLGLQEQLPDAVGAAGVIVVPDLDAKYICSNL